ncbi:MAG: hypothetical protein U0228_20350 [Myxococcaceae bacterium]
MFVLALALAASPAVPEVNLLSIEAGAVLLDSSPSYGGTWSAEALADGAAGTGWSSPSGARGPFHFTFELEQRSVLTAIEVDNTNAEEPSYPGISASALEVWVMGAQTDQPTRVATLKLGKRGKARLALPKDTTGRIIKLVVPGNLGHASYTELMEVAVLGHPLEPTPSPTRSLDGLWSLDDGVVVLTADQGAVSGCVRRANDALRFTGTVQGRVAQGSLEGLDRLKGSATFVVSSDGNTLRARYEMVGFGTWKASRRDALKPDCATLIAEAALGRRLDAATGPVALLGVGFGPDDTLRTTAGDELTALASLLAERPTARVELAVLGRTDGGADELKRTERRAQAVIQALMKLGLAPERVELGFGVMKWPGVRPEPRVEARWKN